MVQAEGRELMMLSSYDYLGLIGDPRVDEAAIAAIRKYGTGTGGVRMLTGTIDLHREMERDLAEYKGTAEAISFSSGYLANVAVMSALACSAGSSDSRYALASPVWWMLAAWLEFRYSAFGTMMRRP